MYSLILLPILLCNCLQLVAIQSDCWLFTKHENGKTSILCRAPIRLPKNVGFATLTVEKGVSRIVGKRPGVVLNLLIENPKNINKFPFESLDGPVDKTDDDYIMFIAIVNGKNKEVKCMPNGGFSGYHPTGFEFSTREPHMIAFLRGLAGGSYFLVQVHSASNEVIELEFKTDGLKDGLAKLLD